MRQDTPKIAAERKAFERAHRRWKYDLRRGTDGCYEDRDTFYAWCGWLARSRRKGE